MSEQTWHPLLAAAFQALDEGSIEWCLLRPPSCPEAPTGDVDLLVSRRHTGSLPGVLGPLGFARIPDAGSPDRFYLRYDRATDCWVYLHLTSEVAVGPRLELDTGSAFGCLARRVRRGGAWCLAPEDEFWVTLLHALIDKRVVSEQHRERLTALASSAVGAGPVADAVAARVPAPWIPARVLECARDGKWVDLQSFGEALEAHWRERAAAEFWAMRLRSVARLGRGLANPWRRRGLSVALLGPDGAGKSTLAAGIREHWFFPSSSFYMDVKDDQLAQVARLRVPGLTFGAYLAMLWARLVAARWRQARGELVVFDRYTYDALSAIEALIGPAQRLARWVHPRLFPRAGLALVLDLPGELMYARKRERTPEDLEAERHRLLRIGERVPNVEVLDATQPADVLRRDATARIWAEYSRRWTSRATWAGHGPSAAR